MHIINAGDYTVKIDVAGNDIYNSAHDLTADGWKFTIAKATQNIDAPAEYALTYGETGKITASTDGDGVISYAVTTGSDVISVAADGTITVLKAGTATVEITAAETANYTFSYTNGTLTVSNKETQTITANDVTLTYGETGKITAATDGDGVISYAVTAGSDVISVAAD